MKRLPKCKGKYGYTTKQIREICKELKIDENLFWESFGINTCAMWRGMANYYRCDVEKALYNLGHKLGKYHEWD